MMKKFVLLILLLAFWRGMAQQNGSIEYLKGFILDTLTTAELDALPSAAKVKGAYYHDITKGNLVGWDGAGWADVGVSGSSYTAGTGINIVSNEISVEDSELNPEWGNITGKPVNLDEDSTNDVTLTGAQSISGEKTFTNADTNFNGRVNLEPIGSASFESGYGNISLNASSNLRVVGSGLTNRYILNADNITAERTFTLPNASGTLALISDITGLSALEDDPSPGLGGNLAMNGRSILGDFNPASNGAYDLGVPSFRWENAYINRITSETVSGHLRFAQVSSPLYSGDGYGYFDSDDDNFYLHNGSAWKRIAFYDELDSGSVPDDTGSSSGDVLGTDGAGNYNWINDTGIASPYAPGNYTPVSSTIRGQFQGIDTALGSLGNKVDNTISGRTGDPVNAMMIQDEDDYIADGDPGTNEVVFCRACAPMQVGASATIDIDKYRGYDDRSTDAGTFTFDNLKTGAAVLIEINRATDAAYSGITIAHTTGAFAANTRQLVTIFVLPSGDVLRDYKDLE